MSKKLDEVLKKLRKGDFGLSKEMSKKINKDFNEMLKYGCTKDDLYMNKAIELNKYNEKDFIKYLIDVKIQKVNKIIKYSNRPEELKIHMLHNFFLVVFMINIKKNIKENENNDYDLEFSYKNYLATEKKYLKKLNEETIKFFDKNRISRNYIQTIFEINNDKWTVKYEERNKYMKQFHRDITTFLYNFDPIELDMQIEEIIEHRII